MHRLINNYHVVEFDDGHSIRIHHMCTLTRYQVQAEFSETNGTNR